METRYIMSYAFRIDPFPHQREEWEQHRETAGRAILWEQGTGKSKEIVDQASWCYRRGLIDAVIVVAPNGVHRNWVEEEIPTHTPDDIMPEVRAMFYQSDRSGSKWHKAACLAVVRHQGLSWFTISYEAFTTVAGKQALIEMFDKRKVFYVLDEAHYISNPEAKRTESILLSAKYAVFRRALTGTPISTGPFNLYSLVNFIDPTYWTQHGFSTFIEFKNHFAIFDKGWDPGGWTFDPVTKRRTPGRAIEKLREYRRLDELHALLQPLSSRVTKAQVLDLVPKKYRKVKFTMSPEQDALYQELKQEYMIWVGSSEAQAEAELGATREMCFSCGGSREIVEEGYVYQCPECTGSRLPAVAQDGTLVVATMAMTRLLRLQQITCGYVPTPEDEDEPVYMIPGRNHRLEKLEEIICDRVVGQGKKVIVWARFQMDITSILAMLERVGIRAVRYDGQVDDDGRSEAKALFKGERPIIVQGVLTGREKVPREEQADVFVGNPSAGATGLTLNIAKVSVYYSNSFKLIDRLQSEDRNHRIGQDEEVEYIDLIAAETVDEKIVSNLREKLGIANQILGDRAKEWL